MAHVLNDEVALVNVHANHGLITAGNEFLPKHEMKATTIVVGSATVEQEGVPDGIVHAIVAYHIWVRDFRLHFALRLV